MTDVEVTLARHDERIRDLEDRQKTMEKAVNEIRSNTNKILGGICVACILLAVNVVIMLAGKMG